MINVSFSGSFTAEQPGLKQGSSVSDPSSSVTKIQINLLVTFPSLWLALPHLVDETSQIYNVTNRTTHLCYSDVGLGGDERYCRGMRGIVGDLYVSEL